MILLIVSNMACGIATVLTIDYCPVHYHCHDGNDNYHDWHYSTTAAAASNGKSKCYY